MIVKLGWRAKSTFINCIWIHFIEKWQFGWISHWTVVTNVFTDGHVQNCKIRDCCHLHCIKLAIVILCEVLWVFAQDSFNHPSCTTWQVKDFGVVSWKNLHNPRIKIIQVFSLAMDNCCSDNDTVHHLHWQLHEIQKLIVGTNPSTRRATATCNMLHALAKHTLAKLLVSCISNVTTTSILKHESAWTAWVQASKLQILVFHSFTLKTQPMKECTQIQLHAYDRNIELFPKIFYAKRAQGGGAISNANIQEIH